MSKTLINRALLWIRRSLDVTEKSTMPTSIEDEMRATVDAFGWERATPAPEFISATTAGPTVETELPEVPEGEMHLFIAFHVVHDDPVLSAELRVAHRQGPIAIDSGVTIRESTESGAFEFRVIQRPFLVSPGGRLVGISDTSIALGSDLIVAGQFLRLAIGEYVPGSPYG